MYTIAVTSKFKKDVVKCKKRGYDIQLLQKVVNVLQHTGNLPTSYKPHKLIGNFVHHWEAHIKPDWLILWIVDNEKMIITLVRTGTHSDLF